MEATAGRVIACRLDVSRWSPRSAGLAALLGAVAVGCDLPSWLTGEAADSAGAGDDVDVKGLGMVAPVLDAGTTAKPPGPLERSRRKLTYVTKDARHLGFNLRTLAETYALAGAVEVPDWSDPGDGDPLDTRDDDLTTGWRCTPSRETTCAFGIHFPEPATVSSVRLWTATAPGEAWEARPRLEEIRVHTDEGYGDVIYHDEDDFAYAIFGRPVVTSQLTVEVIAVHEGKTSEELQLGDFEAFGEAGAARPPMDLDPAVAVVRPGASAWRKSGMTYKLEGSFVDLAQPDGSLRRFAPGSALYGDAGDRILLLEQMLQSVCKVQQGRYFAIDTHTRVWLPLGDLGGLPGMVFGHAQGEGFAVGYVDRDNARMQGIFREPDSYVRRKTHRTERTPYEETLTEWGVQDGAIGRGGAAPADAGEPCRTPTAEALAPLAKVRGGKAPVPERWLECALGLGHTAFASSGGECGSAWEVHVLAPSGRSVAQRKGAAKKKVGAQLHVRATQELGLLVEVDDGGEKTRTFVVRTDDIFELPAGTGLAARIPAACRKRCTDDFPNPRAPS